MSHEKLEQYVAESAVVPKLRDRITAGRVEDYFRRHACDFDAAWIARFEVADEREARAMAEQIRAGSLEFLRQPSAVMSMQRKARNLPLRPCSR